MCGTYDLTRVLSASYGLNEDQFPKRYVERQCNEVSRSYLLKRALSMSNECTVHEARLAGPFRLLFKWGFWRCQLRLVQCRHILLKQQDQYRLPAYLPIRMSVAHFSWRDKVIRQPDRQRSRKRTAGQLNGYSGL